MLVPLLQRLWVLSLVEATLCGAVAGSAMPGAPVIRIAVLPSASERVDRKLVRVACQIGGLTPEFQNCRSFDEARHAWLRGETDAIAGITLEQAIILGGRFLPAYRELRLRAVARTDSLVLRPGDLKSVPVISLPDGWGALHARARGWDGREVQSFQEAAEAVQQGQGVALLDETSASLLPQGFRQIDLGIAAPVSVAIPAESPCGRSLEMGLESLIRTGYADRFRARSETGPGVTQGWIRKDTLVLVLTVVVATGLMLARLRIDPAMVLPRPSRSILATGR